MSAIPSLQLMESQKIVPMFFPIVDLKKNWSEVTSCLRDELQSFVVDELQVNHATSLKMFICNIFLWTFEHADFWLPKHHDNFENLLKSDPG